MRKLFSLFLALLPIAAGANTVTDGTFSYEEDEQGGLVITGLAPDVAPLSGDVVLPAETEIDGTARAITGMSCSFGAILNKSALTGLDIRTPITEIPAESFREVTTLQSIKFPESLLIIANYAFESCTGLTGNLIIPNSVTTIGNFAFSGCSGFTGSLTIPNSVTAIKSFAFSGCSGFTGSLTIPNSVTTIGNSAFSGCSGFTGNLTIPNSVTNIEGFAFLGCSGFTGDLVIPNSVTTIETCAFEGCSGFTGNLTIPNSVTTIGLFAFQGCSGFTGDLVIPNSVTTIGGRAFEGCSGFTGKLSIPESVSYIRGGAFRGCKGFSGSITIPQSVLEIGGGAFYGLDGVTDFQMTSSTPPTINDIYDEIKVPFSTNSFIGVPTGCAEAYRTNEDWAVYENLYEFGDANIDKRLTIADVVAVANNIIGAENSSFNEFIADINFDETITVNDAVRIVDAVLTYAPEEAAHAAARAPRMAGGMLTADDFRLGSDGKAAVGVRLSAGQTAVALQCDFVADGGIAIDGIVPDAELARTHSVKMQQLGDGRVRVVIFSLDNRAIDTEGRPLFALQLHGDAHSAAGSLHGERVLVSLPDATDSELSFDGGNNLLETGLMDAMQSGPKAVGADGTLTILHAEGMQVEIYSADGRLLDAFTAASEVETRRLGAGIYIVKIGNVTTKIIL